MTYHKPPSWRSRMTELDVKIYGRCEVVIWRDQLDRVQVGHKPADDPNGPDPLVWVGHNQ